MCLVLIPLTLVAGFCSSVCALRMAATIDATYTPFSKSHSCGRALDADVDHIVTDVQRYS